MQRLTVSLLFLLLVGVSNQTLSSSYAQTLPQPTTTAHLRINDESDGVVTPGVPSWWQISYTDNATNRPVHHFMEMHGKLLHVIVVSADLRQFAHIHPALDHMRGAFRIQVNTSTTDPDNFALPRTVTQPGRHYVFTEAMPHATGNQEMAMAMDRFAFTAEGLAPNPGPLPIDLQAGQTKVVKYFKSDSSEGSFGDEYRVTFEVEQLAWCSWHLPKFYVTVEERVGDAYAAPTNFEPWLEMGGHGVLIGEDEAPLANKVFYHLHAFLPMATAGEFTFPYHDHTKPLPDGVYKLFVQVKHQGVVLTLPFVFEYKNPSPSTQAMVETLRTRCLAP